jgi:hypothetical protein
MSRQTMVRVAFPDPEEAGAEVEQTWSVLTHQMADEYWSEVLDGNRHPHVLQDPFGFDTVQKAFGDTPEASRQSGLATLRRLVREQGGRVVDVGGMEEG